MPNKFEFIQFNTIIPNLINNFGLTEPWNIFKLVVDVILVSFCVYKIVVLARETRAWQLIKGILILLITAKLVELLGMAMTSYLLNSTVQYIAIAFVVVFQPELRRALEQIGRSRLQYFFSFDEEDETQMREGRIQQLVRAAFDLSKQKIGALMVIERETKLGEFMSGGIRLDSVISSQLLGNIFVPNTPLHDGAVIIRGGKIISAACLLPLSDNPLIRKDLGTRHRAGIGISEVSDAIAIVVSEETGKVSLSVEGKFEYDVSREDAIRLLNELCKRETTQIKRLKIWKFRQIKRRKSEQ